MASRRIRLIGPLIVAALFGSAGVARAGDWTITPSLGDQEEFTDNVLFTPDHTRSDLLTTISPGIAITGTSPALQGTLNYSPTIYRYALTPSQNTTAQSLYANETATVIPETLFFDTRAYASLLPTTPGLSTGAPGPSLATPNGFSGTTGQVVPANELSQTVSLNASPYVVHRFDGFGTAELRYTLSDTVISSPQVTPLAPAGFTTLGSRQLTNEGTASFLTGDDFGPLVTRLTLDGARSSGSGADNSARQFLAIADSAYRITPRIALLTTLGHETIDYNGFPPTHIDDLVWGTGLQLKPADATVIDLSYGHRNGVTAPNASVIYTLSGTTTLSATYSEGLSTTAQDIANNLAVSDINQEGQVVDTRTLLPLVIANPALGLQSGLFRSRQFAGTADISLERNHFTATINESESILVAQSVQGVGASQNSTNATLGWAREVGPRTTANVSAGYTMTSAPSEGAFGQEGLLTVGDSISYMFSASVSGWAGCNRYERSSPDPALRLSADSVFAGLRKSF